MILPERPEPPRPSPDVEQWLCERGAPAIWPVVVGRDAPADVLAFLDARAEWLAADEEWRRRSPVDFDIALGSRGGVRFFGGDWLTEEVIHPYMCAVWGGEMRTVAMFLAVRQAFDRMDEPEFRAFVAGIYEHIRAKEAAHVALVKLLHAGAGK